ncbi:MAG TPA: hypothetical protein VGV35_03405, partial [Bryobacteraceae bacterium]|nr:hypothetical protein [Bryobacteraceae bacterium]
WWTGRIDRQRILKVETVRVEEGAKVIHYVGWADSAIAPANSVNYYDSVRAELAGVEPRRQAGDRWEEIQEFFGRSRLRLRARQEINAQFGG